MICPLCEKEHYDPYKVKVQRLTHTGKTNLAEGRICRECALQIIYKLEKSKEDSR